MKSLTVYIQSQAESLAEYLKQEVVLSLAGWIPSLPGIALRGLLYRAIMRLEGTVAIETGVRLRFTRNIHLHNGVYVDSGVYMHATPGGIEVGEKTFLM